MSSINYFIENDFNVFNINDTKQPVNKKGVQMFGWQKKTSFQLQQEHNLSSKLWGMKMGLQCNDRVIMSLDFDCCGKEDKTSGKRVGCQETINKLKNYSDNIDRQDGMFSSSTDGNMNVLVDYTDSITIQSLIEKLNEKGCNNKFKNEELEVLIGGYQAIPPSQTKSKITKELGNARTFLNDNYLYIINDENDKFIVEFLSNLINIKLQEYVKTTKNSFTPITPPSTPTNTEGNNTVLIPTSQNYDNDKYLDLLFNVIKNDLDNKGCKKIERETWLSICYILKSNNYDIQHFINYSNLNSIANKTKNTAEKTFNSLKVVKESPLYILQGIAKKVNLSEYNNWLIKHKSYLSLKTLEKGENDVAKYITNKLKSKLVFCNKKWYEYSSKLGLWNVVSKPAQSVISCIQECIDEAMASLLYKKLNTDDEEEKKKYTKFMELYTHYYSSVCKGAYSTQVITLLTSYLCDNEFSNILDNNKYKIVYKNGILDLKTLVFRNGLFFDDYITAYIPYNYEVGKVEDIATVREILKKICNYNEEHLEFYLSYIGYCMCGDASIYQNLFQLLGQTACNGKSTLFDVLLIIMPNYVSKTKNSTFEINNATRHKEIAGWKGKRIIFTNELSQKKQDETIIKEIADGTCCKNDVMFGTTELINITFKLTIISNHSISIKADAGFARRLMSLQLDSNFVDDLVETEETTKNKQFKKDDKLIPLLTGDLKHALMSLIFSYSKKFVDDGSKLKAYPKEWLEVKKEQVDGNNTFNDFFNSNFVVAPYIENKDFLITEGKTAEQIHNERVLYANRIPKQEIDKFLEKERIKVNFKDELKRMKIAFKYDSQFKSGGYKGFYLGIKFGNNYSEEETKEEKQKEEEKEKVEIDMD
jgi:hypothetical protein